MGHLFRRHIGQILVDGSFMSKDALDHALKEQTHTRELLGQVLVRMGVLKPKDMNAPLMVQKHLGTIDDAVRIAAGERQLLGALLVQSGHISCAQLDQAISEQKRSGEKLGEVFVRLNMLTELQIAAILDFQHNQGDANTVSPLRLGELLVGTGYISRDQLNDALLKQSLSHKKLGEVLVDEGYATPGKIKRGVRLQKMLVTSVLAAILSLGTSAISHASSVQLQWDPNAESDVAGYKVYYAPDSSPLSGTVPVDVQNQTIATISGLDPSTNYNFAVTAYNTAGLESSFSNIVPVAEQIPPTVSITSPASGNPVSGVVSVSVTATDNVGVTKVEFYVNNQLQATDTSGPYVYSWDTTSLVSGTYTLTAKAYDAAGNVSQSSSSVTVLNDVTAPVVALTSPSNNSIVKGSIIVNAGASDNVGVSKVEFYNNGVLIYASNVSPYNFYWDTTSVVNGNYTLQAKALDNTGNSSLSSSVTVTVANPVPDVTAPTLASFTLPTTSTSLTVPVTGLTASDNVGVTGFIITESGSTPAATATGWSASAPAAFTFAAEGARTAYAWAKDAAGNVSAAKTASVTITLPDVTAPTLASFTLPATSTSLTVPVTGLTASDNVGVTGYLITESASVPTASAAGWSATAPTSITFSSVGSKTAYAWAKDAAGNVSAYRSATVTIATSVSDVIAPVVSIPSPIDGAIVKRTVTVTAGASDNVKVTKVEFYVNGVRKSTKTTAPYTYSWNTRYVHDGAYTLTAKAYDAAGNVSQSNQVNVTVHNY